MLKYFISIIFSFSIPIIFLAKELTPFDYVSVTYQIYCDYHGISLEWIQETDLIKDNSILLLNEESCKLLSYWENLNNNWR